VLVEDDPAVAQTMADALDSSGYRVRHAATGSAARALVEQSRPDLIVLDLMLPDVDGLVLCSGLKQLSPTPIVICSATPEKRDAILGLKLGADDFIPKPFDIYELEARLQAVLRRSRRRRSPERKMDPGKATHLANLSIDPARRSVRVGAEPLALTPTEYRLLATLADRIDEVVTRKELAQNMFRDHKASTGRSIEMHVWRLRAKLGRTRVPAPAIVAVHGLGYKLASAENSPHEPA